MAFRCACVNVLGNKVRNIEALLSSRNYVKAPPPNINPDEEAANKDGNKVLSPRMQEFKQKLRETTPIKDLGEQMPHPAQEKEPLENWPDNVNPNTGEYNGPRGPEPTRYGDWERKGRVSDF